MTVVLTGSMRTFVDYFGELGPRWGLEAPACRAHACLYLLARPTAPGDVARALGTSPAETIHALDYLAGWGMASVDADGRWTVGSDPSDMLFSGLEQRRQRELAPALQTLRDSHAGVLRERAEPGVARRIGQVLALVEDLASLDSQAGRLSPRAMRRMVGLGGSAARILNRTLPPGR